MKKKGEGNASEEFLAVRGWVMRFKALSNYHNLKIHGKAASRNEKAVSEFPKVLVEIIREGGYSAH